MEIPPEEDPEMDKQYMCPVWSIRGSAEYVLNSHMETIKKVSAEVILDMPLPEHIKYGPSTRQRMAVFTPKDLPKDGPILVFLHGGYWQMDRSHMDYLFVGTQFLKAGATVVHLDYDLAPEVKMEEIVAQARLGMKHILKIATERGSRGVYVSGHSAGGHLSAMILSACGTEDLGENSAIIKGAILMSGIFDVRPIAFTSWNKPLLLTKENAWFNSPSNYVDTVHKHCQHMEILVVLGEHESPEFHRQAMEYTKALQTGGIRATYLEVKDTDHFDLVERLIEPDYEFTKEILKLMKLT